MAYDHKVTVCDVQRTGALERSEIGQILPARVDSNLHLHLPKFAPQNASHVDMSEAHWLWWNYTHLTTSFRA